MIRLLLTFVICTASTLAIAAEPDFYCLDFQSKANHKLADQFHGLANPGNNLARLPRGDFKFGEVKFTIGDSMLQLASATMKDKPDKFAGLELDLPVAKLHFLHGTGFAPEVDPNLWTTKGQILVKASSYVFVRAFPLGGNFFGLWEVGASRSPEPQCGRRQRCFVLGLVWSRYTSAGVR